MPSQVVKLRNEHAEQRDDPEGDEEHQRRDTSHPSDGPAPPAARGGRAPLATGGRSERGHWPMTAFMLSANCCGVMRQLEQLGDVVSSTSAAVGLSAWSQDCAKTLALLATS